MDRAADSGPCDPSSIPLGEKKENKRKEAGVGPLKKKKKKKITINEIFVVLDKNNE